MNCCSSAQCEGLQSLFGKKLAEDELRDYRAKGPSKTTAMMLAAIRAAMDVRGATLLDVGGGVGSVHHELLKSGLASAVDVDASSAYIAASRQEAERLGHAGRLSHQFGNFVDLAAQIANADVVALDRVICCFPEVERMVGESARKAQRIYALVFPKSAWWMRLARSVANAFMRLIGHKYRFFVHPSELVHFLITSHGLRQIYMGTRWMWQVRVYAREGWMDSTSGAECGCELTRKTPALEAKGFKLPHIVIVRSRVAKLLKKVAAVFERVPVCLHRYLLA